MARFYLFEPIVGFIEREVTVGSNHTDFSKLFLSDKIRITLIYQVKIKILVNEDEYNQNYIDCINNLNEKGADIRLINLGGIMHHKFCVIDEKKCLYGSFNWTKRANYNNFEDLNITIDKKVVNNYLSEFKALWELNKEDLCLLNQLQKCNNSREPIINILFMELSNNLTEVKVLQVRL